MDAKFLYEVFQETEKNGFPDLMLGVAAAQVEHPLPHEEDRAVREFIGRHYDALVATYASHDKEAFAAKVAKCQAEDAEENHDGDAGEDEA